MSGSARLALCATLATLAASCALLPLVNESLWLAQAAFLLAVQAVVGALARRVPLPRVLTVAVQALVTLLMLTVAFAREQALAGVLPGPEALRTFADLLRQGADDVGRYAIPAPATAGIRLLLIAGVLVVGLVVDALSVTFRSAAPAGLPLLALYSISAGLARGGADWLWFLVAAAGYLLLLLAEGRDRLARWGRVFPGGARAGSPGFDPAAGGGTALAPVRTGRRIGALALGIALAIPAVLPAIDGGLLRPHGRGEGPGGDAGGTISAVNPLVSLQNSLNQPENREVLRYRTTTAATQDLYLRIVALDHFDGSSWRASERQVTEVPERLPLPEGLAAGVRTDPVNTSVVAAPTYGQNYLPMPYPADRVQTGGKWRYEPEGRVLVGDHGQTTRGLRYQVTSLFVQPTAAQLAAAPAPEERILREYTRVPAGLPKVVERTARQVTAGAANPYQQAVKLQDWFALGGGFRYDTEVESGSGENAIVRFLTDKRGFCVHFSFTMAAMARTLGIPARVAVGFTSGTPQPDGSVSVGSKDAHAWPELYFEGVGWTRFEPTPSRGSQPDYTIARGSSGTPADVPSPSRGRDARPSAAPESGQPCPPRLRRADGCPQPLSQPGGGASAGGPPGWALAGLGAAGLAAVLLTLPPLLRGRVRARRLGPGRGTLAAWRELTDSAWDYGIPPDGSHTPRQAVTRIVRLGGLSGPAAGAAGRVATAVEQALYAPHPMAALALAEEVRRVRAGLRAAAPRWTRVRAVLAPRSLARLLAVALPVRMVFGRSRSCPRP
ncbi:transglutaminase TgpA family protein [Streptomyces orinoci]|uniref:DUF3488 and transglutaminase-like domain-containing protein n=1 Tax=Streptomyces orinoci TaxID=67339 RepID=A0ABV3JXN7_STRON|nr:DUF3488 and transglutaminase-like domain-containing protein [Streptomyces orinoci]